MPAQCQRKQNKLFSETKNMFTCNFVICFPKPKIYKPLNEGKCN